MYQTVPAVRESRKPIPGQQQPQQQIMTYPWHVDGLEKSGGGGKSKTLGSVLGNPFPYANCFYKFATSNCLLPSLLNSNLYGKTPIQYS